MFQSLLPSLQRAAIATTHHHHAIRSTTPITRLLSSQSSSSSVKIAGHKKISSFNQIVRPFTSTTTRLHSSKDDDDWYDGYDDFVGKIDSNAQSQQSNNRGDGRGWGGENRRRGGGRSSNHGPGRHDYHRDSSDSGSVDEGAVNELLASRLEYRKTQDYNAADGVRDELLNVHGVTVWDKEMMWTTRSGGSAVSGGGRGGRGGGRGGRGGGRGDDRMNEHGHDYSRTGGPIESTLTENEINALLKERMECKFARDFESADNIQEELLSCGVDVHDGCKEWRADGEQWARSKRANVGPPGSDGGSWGPKEYHQRGPGRGLSEEQVETITAMVADRSEAKSVRDYPRADSILKELSDTYNVNVDDRSGEWHLLNEGYFLSSHSPFSPDEEVQKTVGQKLGERILARKNRNFDLADDIRNELMDAMFVEIDDRTMEWTMAAPAAGGVQSSSSWDEEEDDEEDIEDGAEDDDSTEDNEEESSSITEEENNIDSPSLDDSDLSSMTVPELKIFAAEIGLPVSGTKSELIDRLINA